MSYLRKQESSTLKLFKDFTLKVKQYNKKIFAIKIFLAGIPAFAGMTSLAFRKLSGTITKKT
ncbi:hypothetical protein [Rickettsia honei]|uniref:hypothetical protein n=1 Tax=Rickettsia honei TaxID=37816 RepID=UPI0003172220|nr:hypothetical protein [Rickettsia honei]